LGVFNGQPGSQAAACDRVRNGLTIAARWSQPSYKLAGRRVARKVESEYQGECRQSIDHGWTAVALIIWVVLQFFGKMPPGATTTFAPFNAKSVVSPAIDHVTAFPSPPVTALHENSPFSVK
jgi:hypothetical protein